MGEERNRIISTFIFPKTISENEKCFGIVTVNLDHHGQTGGCAGRGSPFPKGGGLR